MAERRGLILLSVLIGTLMSAIDTTIVILALPTITGSFKNASFIETIWVILIYLLVLAVLTTQMGRLGDIFGRGRIFNTGFLIFITGSGLAGLSPTVDFLIAFRALQGFGAVLIQANSSAIVADHFPLGERGKAFGITSMGWNIGERPASPEPVMNIRKPILNILPQPIKVVMNPPSTIPKVPPMFQP